MNKDSIAKLVYDNASKRAKINSHFIEDICEYLVNEYGLEKYIRTLKFEKTLGDYTLAGYSYDNKSISFCINELLSEVKNEIDSLRSVFKFDEFTYRLLISLRTMETIAHEVEHANQHKKENESPKEIESIILSNSRIPKKLVGETSKQYLQRLQKYRKEIYIENYNLCPFERLAEIYSWSLASDISELCKDKASFAKNYSLWKKYLSLLNAYGNQSDPTIFYLKAVNPNIDCSELQVIASGLSEEERLLYGFNVSTDYFYQVNSDKNMTLKCMREINK